MSLILCRKCANVQAQSPPLLGWHICTFMITKDIHDILIFSSILRHFRKCAKCPNVQPSRHPWSAQSTRTSTARADLETQYESRYPQPPLTAIGGGGACHILAYTTSRKPSLSALSVSGFASTSWVMASA